jgi:hypothetical protein
MSVTVVVDCEITSESEAKEGSGTVVVSEVVDTTDSLVKPLDAVPSRFTTASRSKGAGEESGGGGDGGGDDVTFELGHNEKLREMVVLWSEIDL